MVIYTEIIYLAMNFSMALELYIDGEREKKQKPESKNI